MVLQKSYTIPFYKRKSFNLSYLNEDDLREGVIEICNLLKKDIFIVQIFPAEFIAECLDKYCISRIKHYNFYYYYLKDLRVLNNIELSKVRFMNIYSIENPYYDMNRLVNNLKRTTFSLGLDNYLEYSKIEINYSCYGKEVLKKLHKTFGI